MWENSTISNTSLVSRPQTSRPKECVFEPHPKLQRRPRPRSRSNSITSFDSLASENDSELVRWQNYIRMIKVFATVVEISVISRDINFCRRPRWIRAFEDYELERVRDRFDIGSVISLGQDACTMIKTKELYADGQTSYQNSGFERKQRMLLCKHQIERGGRERYRLQKEPPRFRKDYSIREAADQPKDNLSRLFDTSIMVDWHTTHGQLSLKIWKRTAGKSKSWKRFPRSKGPKQTHHRQARRTPEVFEHQFAKSPIWLPAAFLRSQAKKKSLRLGRVVWCKDSDPVPERARRYDPHVHDLENNSFTPHDRVPSQGLDQGSGIRAAGTMVVEGASQEPAVAFIRFTWKDGILANGIGQLDRFLPTGLVFRNRWCVTGYLRNESLADVYSLDNSPFFHSSAPTDTSYEAHVFLDEYHGNCAVYARRHRSRMIQNRDCLESFLYGNRRVVIIRMQKKPVEFRLRNTAEEFPILVNQKKCSDEVALRRRRFHGKPSFAAVAGGRQLGFGSDQQPKSASEGKSALEKKMEKIERVRLKKAQKQRVKRQSQRDKRIAEKLHSTEEVNGAKSVRESLSQPRTQHAHISM